MGTLSRLSVGTGPTLMAGSSSSNLHPPQPLGPGTLTWCGGMVGSPEREQTGTGGGTAAAQHYSEDLLPFPGRSLATP